MEKQQYIAERLANFTPEYVDFLTSGTVETLADTFGEGFGMNDESINVLENGIMLFLLIFIDKKGLVDFIQSECHMTIADAARLGDAVVEALPASLVYELSRVANGQTEPAAVASVSTPAVASLAKPVAPAHMNVEQEKRQQLADLAERFSTVQATPDSAPIPSQNKPFQSVAAQVASVPTAQPHSSAQLTSMYAPLPEPQLQQPAAVQQNTPPERQSAEPSANVQPVQTMGADVERVQGYSAYRERYPHLYTDAEQNKATIRNLAQDSLLKRPAVVETPDFRNQTPS